MLFSAFILGLLGSWHCVAMCGPIALMIPGANGKNRVFTILLYHVGKIAAYVLIGLFIGSFGLFFQSLTVQAIISIAAGLVMVLLALTPFLLNRLEQKGFQLYKPLVQLKGKLLKSSSSDKREVSLYIGFLNGFIPCGMVYMAALGALVQPTISETMLFMVFFGLGTMPFMSALIFSTNLLKVKLKRYAAPMRTAALLFVAAFMLYKGSVNLHQEISAPKLGETFEVCD
jgi:sulfite exporter TauE/SafE